MQDLEKLASLFQNDIEYIRQAISITETLEISSSELRECTGTQHVGIIGLILNLMAQSYQKDFVGLISFLRIQTSQHFQR